MAEHSLLLTEHATVRCVVCEASMSAVGLTAADVVFLEESHCATVQDQLDVQPLFDAITALGEGDRSEMVRAVLGLPEVASILDDLERINNEYHEGSIINAPLLAFDALRAVPE